MSTNWPPVNAPAWPPAEANTNWLSFSDIKSGINFLKALGFTWSVPTPTENTTYFSGVKCDKGHNVKGIMVVSPSGVRYPFSYCLVAAHKTALVLWIVGYDANGNPHYDLGNGSGNAP